MPSPGSLHSPVLDRRRIADVLAQLTSGSRTVVRFRLETLDRRATVLKMGRLQPDDARFDDSTPSVVMLGRKGGPAAILLVGEAPVDARARVWSLRTGRRLGIRLAESAGSIRGSCVSY